MKQTRVKSRIRIFSTELKKEIVKDIEHGRYTVKEISEDYLVSKTSIYKWLNKYSRYLKSQNRLVVEKQSEQKRNQELKNRLKELERIVGQKQLEIDYLNRLINEANKIYKADIKKNFDTKS